MSIKFRCPHCRQFLGISNSRAGKIVDCPTCGRALRVPDLDGRVRPMPKPALNLSDSGLVKALDEVAHIGNIHVRELRYGQAAEAPNESESPVLHSETIEPLPLPDVVPIEPPLPAEIVSGPELPSPVEKAETSVDGNLDDHASAIVELAALSAMPQQKKPARARLDWRDFSRRSHLLEPMVLAVMAAIAIIALGAGYFAATLSQPTPPRGIAANGENQAANGAAKDNVAGADGQPAASVRGRITEKNAMGESHASVGVKIIAFPTTPPSGAKLSAAGFRATATDEDFLAAQVAMRKAGGDVAVADDQGNFELTLPSAGTYSLLVLSRSQSRESQQPVEAPLKQLLETHFDRPEILPGESRYHFGRILYRGSGTDLWDYSFEGE